jgi:nucleotide-binding universal stress UspA family protein
MRRILITTEGSTCSSEALRQFVGLFDVGPNEIYLLSVVPLSRRPDGHPEAAEHYHRACEEAQEALDLAAADLAVAGFSAFSVVRIGHPAEAIVEVAREISADLIVLGTHGRQGLDRLMNGSVAESVLHHAPCAVFIHPHQVAAEV